VFESPGVGYLDRGGVCNVGNVKFGQ